MNEWDAVNQLARRVAEEMRRQNRGDRSEEVVPELPRRIHELLANSVTWQEFQRSWRYPNRWKRMFQSWRRKRR